MLDSGRRRSRTGGLRPFDLNGHVVERDALAERLRCGRQDGLLGGVGGCRQMAAKSVKAGGERPEPEAMDALYALDSA